jgi:hypothetical protein
VIIKKTGLVAMAGAVAAVGIAVPSIAGGNKFDAETSTRDCGDGDAVTLVGPLKLWPPNHKFVAEPVTATDADGSGPVTITITPVVTDATGGDGGSNHDPDTNASSEEGTIVGTGDGAATAAMELRAERSGRGEGRTYTINWLAQFDDKTCEGEPFIITVPHDMGGGNDGGRNGSKPNGG